MRCALPDRQGREPVARASGVQPGPRSPAVGSPCPVIRRTNELATKKLLGRTSGRHRFRVGRGRAGATIGRWRGCRGSLARGRSRRGFVVAHRAGLERRRGGERLGHLASPCAGRRDDWSCGSGANRGLLCSPLQLRRGRGSAGCRGERDQQHARQKPLHHSELTTPGSAMFWHWVARADDSP
jgi:hypothetical protein